MKYFRLINKFSFKYLAFLLICIFGCIYHVVQISKVYFSYSTNVNVYVDFKSQIKVLLVSICRWTETSLKKSFVNEIMTPRKLYEQTFHFTDVFFKCEISDDGFNLKYFNFSDLAKFGIKMEKKVNDIFVCYVFKHPQFNKNIKRKQGIIYRMFFHQLNDDESWLFLNSETHKPNGKDWNTFKLSSQLHYMLSFSLRSINLLPSPYKTNCIDYRSIGFHSKSDCIDHWSLIIDHCLINLSLVQCKALPSYVNINVDQYHDQVYNESNGDNSCVKVLIQKFVRENVHLMNV